MNFTYDLPMIMLALCGIILTIVGFILNISIINIPNFSIYYSMKDQLIAMSYIIFLGGSIIFGLGIYGVYSNHGDK